MRILGSNKGAIEVLILANALAFIITLINQKWVFMNFALQPATVFVKPWTIVTNMFLHAGLGHIAFNMIALFFFGIYLEQLVGEERFLKIYLWGGVFASIAYVFTSIFFGLPSPTVFAVGASGAVFAIMGALVVLRPNMTILYNFFIPMPLWVWAIIYTIIAVPEMLYPVGSIAHNAHLGGMLAGYYFGKRIQAEGTGGGGYGYRFY
ncbi:MAG: rhomboid family intramembrane serine protease [Candidatus Altiarchaeota archaeon]